MHGFFSQEQTQTQQKEGRERLWMDKAIASRLAFFLAAANKQHRRSAASLPDTRIRAGYCSRSGTAEGEKYQRCVGKMTRRMANQTRPDILPTVRPCSTYSLQHAPVEGLTGRASVMHRIKYFSQGLFKLLSTGLINHPPSIHRHFGSFSKPHFEHRFFNLFPLFVYALASL